ncbi:MAG: type I methionyl aminopeptidase [Phycisphaerae bacterium]
MRWLKSEELARMAIKLKDKNQIERMRQAGRIVHAVLAHLRELVKPGVTTGFLDREADSMIDRMGGKALFRGVPNPRAGYPFPACICASIDDEVVHGIPSDQRVLEEGQILSVDCGVRFEGFCGDAAITFPVGAVEENVGRLLTVTQDTLMIAVENIRPGLKWSQVAAKMQAYVERNGFSVVTDFVGHGIGTEMHEDPKIPNFVSRDILRNDILLEPGMVLAVEPMVNMGGSAVRYAQDGWTIVTADRMPSAHFEHTIAVTEVGADVLTDGRSSRVD